MNLLEAVLKQLKAEAQQDTPYSELVERFNNMTNWELLEFLNYTIAEEDE